MANLTYMLGVRLENLFFLRGPGTPIVRLDASGSLQLPLGSKWYQESLFFLMVPAFCIRVSSLVAACIIALSKVE